MEKDMNIMEIVVVEAAVRILVITDYEWCHFML